VKGRSAIQKERGGKIRRKEKMLYEEKALSLTHQITLNKITKKKRGGKG
jgi:hypothetical protein